MAYAPQYLLYNVIWKRARKKPLLSVHFSGEYKLPNCDDDSRNLVSHIE